MQSTNFVDEYLLFPTPLPLILSTSNSRNIRHFQWDTVGIMLVAAIYGARVNYERAEPSQLAVSECMANIGALSFLSNHLPKGSQPTNKRYKMKVKILSSQQCQMGSVC